MTRDEAKQAIAILQAYADGKTIEYKYPIGWNILDEIKGICNPSSYRIKKEPRDFWILILKNNPEFYTEESVKEYCRANEEAIHAREVME